MKTFLLSLSSVAILLSPATSPAAEGLALRPATGLQVELGIDTIAGRTYSLKSGTSLSQLVDGKRIEGTGTPQFRLITTQDSPQYFWRLEPIGYAEYLPLVVGSQWAYEPGYGDGPRVDSITGVENVQGLLCYKWERQEASPDDYHEIRWFFPQQGTVTMHQLWGNEGMTSAITFDPPWLILKHLFAPSETWSQEVAGDGMAVAQTLTVIATNAQVTVPAGTFANCLVLREHTEITSGDTTQHDYKQSWFAPGVGMVMRHSYSDAWITLEHTQELTSYRIGLD